jgi:hypothetical protein
MTFKGTLFFSSPFLPISHPNNLLTTLAGFREISIDGCDSGKDHENLAEIVGGRIISHIL